jgi:hypothetical protein
MRTYSQRRQDFSFENLFATRKTDTYRHSPRGYTRTDCTTHGRKILSSRGAARSEPASLRRSPRESRNPRSGRLYQGSSRVSCRKSHRFSIPSKASEIRLARGLPSDRSRAIGLLWRAVRPHNYLFRQRGIAGSRVGLDKPSFANFFPTVRMSAPAPPASNSNTVGGCTVLPSLAPIASTRRKPPECGRRYLPGNRGNCRHD